MDYLVEEVLDRQPEDVRDFLLGTAILERLTGPLCDAVTETSGGGQMLESLERRNLFVVPLDDQRRWYRYHHLFADVLRAHLLGEHPDRVAGLHRRASTWFQDAGEPLDAVRHALAAGDVDRAADLVELAIPALRVVRREAVIASWAEALPDDVLRNRPVLAIGLVGGLMSSNHFAGVDRAAGRHRAAARAARRRAGRRATATSSPGSRPPSRCTAPPWPSTSPATRRPPSSTRSGPSTGRPRTTT